jgi:hypothetical protein
MKVTFEVKRKVEETGYITLEFKATCDDPTVTVSMSNDDGGKFFLTASPEKLPLVIGDTRELPILVEEPVEEPVEGEPVE